jgi:hypothetical protein
MIRDFARFDGSEPIRCDLCIAGAGAVGISMALEFADRAESVVVLESGGLEYEEASQDLYAGCNIGHPYFDLESIRVRIFGGSTNHWGGMCTPFEPLDFERREWVPYSGWPITLADLESYYVRAHRVIQLGPYNYDVSAVVPPEVHLLPFRPDRIRPKLWRYSTPPLRFGDRLPGADRESRQHRCAAARQPDRDRDRCCGIQRLRVQDRVPGRQAGAGRGKAVCSGAWGSRESAPAA